MKPLPRTITPAALARLLDEEAALALIDVREAVEFATAHVKGASQCPRRAIEERMARLVSCPAVPVVLADDDGRRAALAQETLDRMGYRNVSVLDGGLNRWFSEGRPIERGFHVPSRDLGEKLEVDNRVPTVEPAELHRRIQAGEKVIVLDTRTPAEYRSFTIPGARSVPGAELALRIADIRKAEPDAAILVSCAGRTRAIMGADTLGRMGLPNVASLKNGTSGWMLAGLECEFGAPRTDLPDPSPEARAAAEAYAMRVAAEDGVAWLDVESLVALMGRREEECVYPIDVRAEAEFHAGHIPGFGWYPGGQAVQASEEVVAVKGAAIVFCCDGIARAGVTGSWFRRMGFPKVFAVLGGTRAWREAGRALEIGSDDAPFGFAAAAQRVATVSAADLAKQVQGANPPLVLYVGRSREFADGHVPGARWLSRSWLELRIAEFAPDKRRPIVVADEREPLGVLAAATLQDLGYESTKALRDGMAAWRSAGLPLDTGLAGVMAPPEDVLPAIPHRSFANMVNYLSWVQDRV